MALTGHSTLPESCPICSHEPLAADDCKPNKNLRLTVRAYLKSEEKKRDKARQAEAPTPTPAPQVVAPVAVPRATPAATENEAVAPLLEIKAVAQDQRDQNHEETGVENVQNSTIVNEEPTKVRFVALSLTYRVLTCALTDRGYTSKCRDCWP